MLGNAEFMAFALVTLSLVARISLLLRAQAVELSALNECLLPYRRVLPGSADRAKERDRAAIVYPEDLLVWSGLRCVYVYVCVHGRREVKGRV